MGDMGFPQLWPQLHSRAVAGLISFALLRLLNRLKGGLGSSALVGGLATNPGVVALPVALGLIAASRGRVEVACFATLSPTEIWLLQVHHVVCELHAPSGTIGNSAMHTNVMFGTRVGRTVGASLTCT